MPPYMRLTGILGVTKNLVLALVLQQQHWVAGTGRGYWDLGQFHREFRSSTKCLREHSLIYVFQREPVQCYLHLAWLPIVLLLAHQIYFVL